jgi:hypothetical protein
MPMFPNGVVEDMPTALNDCVADHEFAVVVATAASLRLEREEFTLVRKVSRVSEEAVVRTVAAPKIPPFEFRETIKANIDMIVAIRELYFI